MATIFSYAKARELIKDGDMIAVCHPTSLFGRMTQFFTRRIYTHTGIAIWESDGLYMAELNGGRNHKIPMSQLRKIPFDVYAKPDGLRGIRKSIAKWLRNPIEYGYLAVIAIGILNFFKLKFVLNWRNILVCSGWCVAVYEDAGWPRRSRVLSPGDLAEELELKFRVRQN